MDERADMHHGCFSHVLANVGQVERFNAEGGIPVRFVPRPMNFGPIVFEGAQGADLSVWRSSAAGGFKSVPCAGSDLVTIRYVAQGGIVRRSRSQEHHVGPGQATIAAFDLLRDEEASEGFKAMSATVAIPTVLTAQEALEGMPKAFPAFAPVVASLDVPMWALLHALERVHDRVRVGISNYDLVLPLIAEMIVYQLLTSWPRKVPETDLDLQPLHPRTLRRAKDFIDGNLSHKILLSDVAKATGVGVRRLQSAFRTEVGQTPIRYILSQRLDRVHADLMGGDDADGSIRTIAERWGFTHMGDFGRRYRERFGEKPSDTRRTAR